MPYISIDSAADIVAAGKIIAYPTEAIYGLGCDPLNEQAVRQLIAIKQRPPQLGLILVAHQFDLLEFYCNEIPADREKAVQASWPGPHTWVYPRSDQCPSWLTGKFHSIAVRVSAHPTIAALCRACNSALVSSSANRHGKPALKYAQEVEKVFGKAIGGVVEGSLGDAKKPSAIHDALTGKTLRPG